ncbi:MAG: hypothetical protein ACOZIN_09190 [Myxococcota bacterium]
MGRKLIGIAAAIAIGSAGVALAGAAGEEAKKEQQTQAGMGGAGMAGANEIMGEVVKVETKQLFLKHPQTGVIIPLKLDKNTKYVGETGFDRASLREGQPVRASFNIDGTNNVATQISQVRPGEPTMPPPGMHEPGTGGAGQQPGEEQLPEEQEKEEGGTIY